MSAADLVLVVYAPDLPIDQRAALSRQLRQELLTLDVAAVRPASTGQPPAGAKAGEATAAGALAVSLAPQIMPQLVAVVTSWLRRQHPEISVDIDGQRLEGSVNRDQRDAIINAYLKRVGTKAAS